MIGQQGGLTPVRVALALLVVATACGVNGASQAGTVAAGTQTPAAATTAAAVAGVTFTSVRSPVSRGGTGQVSVRTTPNASCAITVRYKSGPSSAQGLAPRAADASGNATWSWTVGTNTTPGSWPIEVRCGSASAQTTFTVR